VRTRALWRGGPAVGVIGYGTWGLSGPYGEAQERESVAALRRALELGATLIDTADEYGSGYCEELVARVLARARGTAFVSTKVGLVHEGRGHYAVDGEPSYLTGAVHGSLRRLRTDHVDLVYLHRVDPDVPIEDSVGALAELVSAGSVGAIGLSEVSVPQVRAALAVHPIRVVQSEYSLFTRGPEQELLPYLREQGIGFVAFSPLSRGLLGSTTGLVLADGDFRRGLPRFDPGNLEHNLRLSADLAPFAQEREATAAQIALAWVAAQDAVPIPGTRRRERVEENCSAGQLILQEEELRLLDRLFPPGAAAGARYGDTAGALVAST
jgi:aryl-alcohol dehydrogenase-like predicted oxidoreductase